jgi:hypothetical protein
VVGELKHLANPFLVIENSSTQYLVNFDFVSAVSGLSELSQKSGAPDAINWLDNVWFHDLADKQSTSTWFLTGDQIIEGICRRTGFDSLDIEVNSKIFTIPKRAIVAGRTAITGGKT